MSQPQDIKIRALPRGEAKAKSARKGTAAAPPEPSQGVPRWIIYVGTLSLMLLVSPFLLPNFNAYHLPARSTAQVQESSLSSVDDSNVARHLQESLMKQQMMRSRQRLDNMDMEKPSIDMDASILETDPNRSYGVQMDSEDTPERLFKALQRHGTQAANDSSLPDDRISARLVNRKWVNEMEREERVNFVAGFIRSAYDRGYQVEIDQNLVVVGVKKITGDRKVNIDQVIDRMAKQGL